MQLSVIKSAQLRVVVKTYLATAKTINHGIITTIKHHIKKLCLISSTMKNLTLDFYTGKFKSGNFMTKEMPISAEELRDLLHSTDHESEVIGDNFAISKAELNSLLDRSDLLEKWGQAKGTEQGIVM